MDGDPEAACTRPGCGHPRRAHSGALFTHCHACHCPEFVLRIDPTPPEPIDNLDGE